MDQTTDVGTEAFKYLAGKSQEAQAPINLEESDILKTFKVEARPSESFFGRRAQDIMRGVDNLSMMGGGLTLLAGNQLGIPALEEAGRKQATLASMSAQERAPLVPSFTDIGANGDFLGDTVEYLSSSIAEQLPMWAVTIPAGGIGGAVATKAIGAPIFGELTKDTATGIAKDLIMKYGVEEAAKKVAIRNHIGQLAGSWISSTGMEAGSMASDIDNQQKGQGLGYAAAFAPIAGAFDAIPNFHILKNTLGTPVAEKVAKYAVQKFGMETAQTAFEEGTTEGVQTIIEKLASQLADPSTAQFDGDGWMNVIDASIKGFAGGGAVAGVAEIGNRMTSRPGLKPSLDPTVNQFMKDINDMADAMTYDVTPEDMVAAEPAPEQAPTETQPAATEPQAPQDQSQDYRVKLYEADRKRPATDQEKALISEQILVNKKAADIEEELNRSLMEDTESPTVTKYQQDLNDELSRLKEQSITLQSRLYGFDPDNTTPVQTGQPGQKTYIQEKGAQKKGEAWVKKTLMPAVRKLIGPEQGQAVQLRALRNSIVESIKPLANLMAAYDVDVRSIRDFEENILGKREEKIRGTGFAVGVSPMGRITLYIAEPSDILGKTSENKIANKQQYTIPNQIKEEAIHVAYYAGLRNEWEKTRNKRGGSKNFEDFITRKEGMYADAIRRSSSPLTRKMFAQLYNRTEALSDSQLASEFIRAIVQKMRTGTLTEEVSVLAALAERGGKVDKIISALMDAIRVVRDAIVNFINPDAAPAPIKEIVDQTNELLDRYTPAVLDSYSENQRRTAVEPRNDTPSLDPLQREQASAQNLPQEAPQPQERAVAENVAKGQPGSDLTEPAPVEAQQEAGNINTPESNQNQSTGNVEQTKASQASEPIRQAEEAVNALRELNQKFSQSGSEVPARDNSGETSGLVDLLRAVAEQRPDTQGKKAPSQMRDYFGELNDNAVISRRAQKTAFDRVADYIEKRGDIGAMRQAASGALGSMEGVDRVLLTGTLARFAPEMVQGIRSSNLAESTKTKRISEILELRDALQDRFAQYLADAGREVNIVGAIKNFFFDGQTARYDMEKALFEKAKEMKETALTKESLGSIYEASNKIIGKVAGRAFTEKGFLTKLSAMMRKLTADPEVLFKKVRDSQRRNKNARKTVVKNVASNAAELLLSPESELYLEQVARKIAKNLTSTGDTRNALDGEKALTQSLNEMARDLAPEKIKVPDSIKTDRLKKLYAVLVNKTNREKFIAKLEKEVAMRVQGGYGSPAWNQFEDYFTEMRDGDFAEGIRNRAVNELKKNLQISIDSMIENGWVENRDQASASVYEMLKDIGATKEQASQVIDQINKGLDEQAEKHLYKTFGFKRDENGKLVQTESGAIIGGKGIYTALQSLGVKLSDLTKLTYAAKQEFVNGLAKNYVESLGLPEEMAMAIQNHFATELTDAVEWKRDADILNRIQGILGSLSAKHDAKPKNVIDELVKMSNQGYLDYPIIYEAIRGQYKKSNLPQFKPEIAQMIRDAGDAMQSLPEGFQKDEIRQKIANELANMGGFTNVDAITSYWYFSLLSGPSTSVINAAYNAANAIATATAMSLDRPSRAPAIWASLIGSVIDPNSQAWQRAWYTFTTGHAPLSVGAKGLINTAKYGGSSGRSSRLVEIAQLPSERITKEMADSPLKKVVYGLSRGVKVGNAEISARTLFRFMAATDQFFKIAARNSALAAYGPDNTAAVYRDALDQAENEAKKGLIPQDRIAVRADDIFTQTLGSNPETAWSMQRAEDIGSEVSFTQRPNGAIGMLARFLSNAGEKYPVPFRLLFPFTNIVANVWNETLNYSPFGAIRWAAAKIDPKGIGKEWTMVDERGNDVADSLQIRKALLGTAVLILAQAIFGNDDDDLAIYGFGPKDKQKRQAWLDAGLKPFSIKIGNLRLSYQYLGPFAVPLGVIGSLNDTLRDNAGKDVKGEDVLMAASAAVLTNQFQQSFLSSFSNMMESVFSTDPGGSLKRWIAMQGSTIMPNIVKQTYNEWIDRDQYRSSDFFGQLMAGMAVTKHIGTQPALNYFGDPLKRQELPILGRIASFLGGDQTIADIDKMGLRLPGYQNRLGDARMTDEQVTQFRQMAGPILKQTFQSMMPMLQRMTSNGQTQQAQDILDSAAQKINASVKMQMLSLDR